MLDINNLTIEYSTSQGYLPVINSINLHIKPGEKLGIVGESGSGKSSLALALMGLSPGQIGGSIIYRGRDLVEQSSKEWEKMRGSTIAMVMQQAGEMLTPVLPLINQVAEPYIKINPGNKSEAIKRAGSLLEKVGLPEHYHRRFPYTLSGGEVQRALLAMALINNPDLLILDEPVSSLDALTREEILQLIEELTADRTVLIISHDLSSVARLADRTAVLYCGSVLETGPTSDLFNKPLHPYTRALVRAFPVIEGVKELQGIRGSFPTLNERPSGCPFHPRCTQAVDTCKHETPPVEYKDGGRTLCCHRGGVLELLRAEQITRSYMLENGSGVKKKEAYLEAVRAVNVSLSEGEVYCLVGESGSGKTTLGRVIAGVDRPDRGTVYLSGTDLFNLPEEKFKQSRRQLQMLFQNSGEALSHRLNVYDLVEEPLVVQGIGDEKLRQGKVLQALEWAQLHCTEDFLHEYPHHLSGGELQRVAIVRALVLEPKVLVADEPSASLDASVQAKIVKLLLRLQNENGFALFLITHDLALAARAGDRIGVMYAGHLVEEGPSHRVIHQPLHPYTKRLLKAASSLKQPENAAEKGSTLLTASAARDNGLYQGCPFLQTCPHAESRCREELPAAIEKDHRKVACHLYQ